IPAALLAGTVLSAPVEAKRMEDPSVHAERLDATQRYFKTKVAKRPSKTIGVGDTERRRTASSKTRKLRLATAKRHKSLTVAAAKRPETKFRKMAHLDAASMAKVLRSGPRPRDLQKLAGANALMSDQAMQAIEGSDQRVTSVIREMAPSYGVPTWFALRIANV